MFKTLCLIALASLLAGCATTQYAIRDAKGCGTTHYNKRWAEANIASLEWSGTCEKRLATGFGTLTVYLKDGGKNLYVGRMLNGDFETSVPGETASFEVGQTLYMGRFSDGVFYSGKVYRSGKLFYEGKSKRWEQFTEGKMYMNNGGIIDGTFVDGASTFSTTGPGVQRGIYYGPDGQPKAWLDSQKAYNSEAAWKQGIEEARVLAQKRSALEGNLNGLYQKLTSARVYTSTSTYQDSLLYYTESQEIARTKIELIDKMRAKCQSGCAYGDILNTHRDKAYNDYVMYQKAIRKTEEDIESSKRMDALAKALEQVAVSTMQPEQANAYRQEQARNEALTNALSRLSGAKGSADFTQSLADIYQLLDK